MLLHAEDAAEEVRDGEKKPCCAALKLQKLTVSSHLNQLHLRVGLCQGGHFFPAGETEVKIPPPDYK